MDLEQFIAAVKEVVERRTGGAKLEVQPLSVSEQISRAVKQLIVKGEIRPGARLLETDLADRFKVSRAPVRDALRILHKEGFVDILPRRGAQVYQPSASGVADLYEIRAELFALTVRKAASGMDGELMALTKKGIAVLNALSEDPKAKPLDFLQLRAGLSVLITMAANNPKLTELINLLGMQTVLHQKIFEDGDQRRAYALAWTRMFNALERRDAEPAAEAARALVFNSRDEILRAMREEPEPPKVLRAPKPSAAAIPPILD